MLGEISVRHNVAIWTADAPTPAPNTSLAIDNRSTPDESSLSSAFCLTSIIHPNTHLVFDLHQRELPVRVEAKTDGDVMGVLAHCSNVRYAVIQASGKKDRPERLVIAYQDENCLRDLIAAPSIFGLGYESREEAMANLEGEVSDAAPSQHEPRITKIRCTV
jgi:hypothetical protein